MKKRSFPFILISALIVNCIIATNFAIWWIKQSLSDFAILGIWFGGGGPWVEAIDFTPDGERIAAGYSYKGEGIIIWDVKTGKQLNIFKEKGWVKGLTFSPDNKFMAIGINPNIIEIRETSSGRLVRRFVGYNPETVVFSSDGKLFASGAGPWKRFKATVWEMPKGTLVRHLFIPQKDLDFWVNGIDFSPNGRFLAVSGFVNGWTGQSNRCPIAFIWEVKTGCLINTIYCPPKLLNHGYYFEAGDIDFSPDGKELAVGTKDDAFYIWNFETGRLKIVQREGGRWWAVKFSPDGRFLATSGAQGLLLLWDIKTMREAAALKGHVLSVYALAFSPKGDLLASGGMDRKVRIWTLKRVLGLEWKRWGLMKVFEPLL